MTQDHGGQAVSDPNAELEAWIAHYGPGLKRYFLKRVSVQEAEDLVQEVFLAMHARKAATPIENAQGYIFSIASNLLAKRRPALAMTALDEASAIAGGFSPEHLFISREEMILAIAAIRKLPRRTREAFILHRFEDMTYAAIARKLDISVSAVSKLIARALAQITEELRAKQ